MRVHIERQELTRLIHIYVQSRPGSWLQVISANGVDEIDVPEGSEPPPFISLPSDLWDAIVDQAPNAAEDYTRTLLEREQRRVDKFIDHVIRQDV